MVAIPLPPPIRPVDPVRVVIAAGERLVRIYDPTRHQMTSLTFRRYGPLARFDHHHAGSDGLPAEDSERGVYYAAWSTPMSDAVASCFVEVFGDRGVVVPGDYCAAIPLVTRDLVPLDLRQSGAMRSGTVAAIAKCDHRLSQPWSRYFYDASSTYGGLDGLLYLNVHNDGNALMLYERAETALSCDDEETVRLDHPELRPLLVRIMNDHMLIEGRSGQ
ncbi:MAG: RES domain-containing protein [Thermomicrobiales bacterium]